MGQLDPRFDTALLHVRVRACMSDSCVAAGPTARDVHDPSHMALTREQITDFIIDKCKALVPEINEKVRFAETVCVCVCVCVTSD